MASYQVILRDRAVETVAADAYQQEGPMTTFFRLGEGRSVVDCWADRVASIRTSDISLVRLAEDPGLRAVG
jgi:hypothetical protein